MNSFLSVIKAMKKELCLSIGHFLISDCKRDKNIFSHSSVSIVKSLRGRGNENQMTVLVCKTNIQDFMFFILNDLFNLLYCVVFTSVK